MTHGAGDCFATVRGSGGVTHAASRRWRLSFRRSLTYRFRNAANEIGARSGHPRDYRQTAKSHSPNAEIISGEALS